MVMAPVVVAAVAVAAVAVVGDDAVGDAVGVVVVWLVVSGTVALVVAVEVAENVAVDVTLVEAVVVADVVGDVWHAPKSPDARLYAVITVFSLSTDASQLLFSSCRYPAMSQEMPTSVPSNRRTAAAIRPAVAAHPFGTFND